MDDIMFVHSGWGNINSIKNSMDLTPWRTLKLTMLSETCMNSTPTAKKVKEYTYRTWLAGRTAH